MGLASFNRIRRIRAEETAKKAAEEAKKKEPKKTPDKKK